MVAAAGRRPRWPHLNLRASDFALSWRGRHDDVVRGYLELIPLDEREQALITPAYWSWMLLGVADELRRHGDQVADAPVFDWTIGHLLRRSPLMAGESSPYRG